MVSYLLKPSWISSAGEESNSWCLIDRGVPQVSPLSPCLYNIFMDTFAEEVSSVPNSVSEQPALLFADDVKLHAKTGKGLQKILDIASSWATRNSIKWNTRPGKSEVLKYKGLPKHEFWLPGQELHQTLMKREQQITQQSLGLGAQWER